jgi:chromosome segregation ATPase
MSNLKVSGSLNRSNKTFVNKSSKKYGAAHENKTFDNKMADVNLDIMKINRKLDKQTDYQEHVQSLMEEEIKLRQEIEKKTFLINEALSSEINRMKQNFASFSNEIQGMMKNNIQKIYDDNQENKTKLFSLNEEIIKKLNEYEKKNNINKDEKYLKLQEIDEKIKMLEQTTFEQYQNLQKNQLSKSQELTEIKNTINNNHLLLNDEINLIKNDISFLKNEVKLLKTAKVNLCGDMGKILKEIEFVNQRFEKTIKEINNSKIELQSKLNNYESTNRLFEENFSNLKEEFLQHLDQISSQKNEDINKISEQVFGQIKQMKTDMDKFNLNIIQENQKFIDYSQGQLQEYDNNMKKLFEFTSDDIEVLKKKSDTLENLLKNTRNEMINNINSVEGFLTNRYDSIFKSISSDRNNNQF